MDNDLEPFTLSQENHLCVIKHGKDSYYAGVDKFAALKLVERLNAAHRPNVEETQNTVMGYTLWVCWNLHEKGAACNWIPEIVDSRPAPAPIVCSQGYRMDI